MEKLIDIIDQPNWKIILYDLVKSNEIDIWNVDLINLTDLYLEKIRNLKEENLIVPANALLAAAILLKLKAYSLKLTATDTNEEELKLLTDDNNYILNNSVDLNTPMRLKEGQVSLDELIDVIDLMMNAPTKKNIERKFKEKKAIEFILPKRTVDFSERSDSLLAEIKENADKYNMVLFSSFTKAEKDPYLVVENYFIPLLFLVQDHKIDAWQEEFFSEIFIKVL
ncbi:MAG TPA: segregation/condensation protein A [archaeon]|nr:segregation/condensation protein A [archaeon]HPV66366.1 segregation/condensation protein A [archaeon]